MCIGDGTFSIDDVVIGKDDIIVGVETGLHSFDEGGLQPVVVTNERHVAGRYSLGDGIEVGTEVASGSIPEGRDRGIHVDESFNGITDVLVDLGVGIGILADDYFPCGYRLRYGRLDRNGQVPGPAIRRNSDREIYFCRWMQG